jgi:hypothetical protein
VPDVCYALKPKMMFPLPIPVPMMKKQIHEMIVSLAHRTASVMAISLQGRQVADKGRKA